MKMHEKICKLLTCLAETKYREEWKPKVNQEFKFCPGCENEDFIKQKVAQITHMFNSIDASKFTIVHEVMRRSPEIN